ncbi:MAG TPA: succinylglutamate desuccinylase/aspartoacylase family protein [Polyangia bacterium]|nr:succinylglutamate desuccinylase/aspartoacylase family protein [Polyangia bacterium]
MVFGDYAQAWRSSLRGQATLFDFAAVVENGRPYPLLAATSPGAATLIITAGFHGDERAGPSTLLAHAPEIVDYARDRDVALRIYPCLNPSGFEAQTRYNASGERPNNDFLKYEVSPGVWKGELSPGEPFLRHVATDGARDSLPKETAALARELGALPTPAAQLDLHQDNFIHGQRFYAYVFGDLDVYRPLMARSGALVPVLRSCLVDSGHEPGTDVRADDEGFILCNDGSITDYYFRRGCPLTAAVETSTETPANLADEINLIWIRGFIDLVAKRVAGPSPAR